jgi:hypothetical protein
LEMPDRLFYNELRGSSPVTGAFCGFDQTCPRRYSADINP